MLQGASCSSRLCRLEWKLNKSARYVYVLQPSFDNLTHLDLGYLLLQVSEGFTLAGCLPRLTDLHVCVLPGQAQADLNLPHLHKLGALVSCCARSIFLHRGCPWLPQVHVFASKESLVVQKQDLRLK